MQRWKISVLLGICITVLLISCVALLLQDDDDDVGLLKGDQIDPPLHPISSTSYANYDPSTKSSNQSQSHQHHDHHHHDDNEQDHAYLQNYRKRFSDVVKGVFKDLINSKNASSTSEQSKESTENNSSRLKRQLDFGSASDENDEGRTSTKAVTSSTPISRRPTFRFTTKKPIIRILKSGDDRDDSTSSAANSDENKIENSGSVENLPGVYRKGPRRVRPKFRDLSPPPSKERYDVIEEDNPKNFTYEVVQVQRKVVRKEDGHIPAYFTKGPKFNIEPRLAKVEKKDAQNRPLVLYRRNPSSEQKSAESVNRKGRPSGESSKESSSSEDKSRSSDDDSREKKVIVNLDQQVPYNDQDLSEEDLKDYHDGHSTFGSKGNFTHTILSRNVAGFLPNNAENSPVAGGDASLRKRTGGGALDRKFVIEKGKVTERYPSRENLFDSPEVEIYTVPGGRSSTESYNRRKPNGEPDLTSPEVPTSFEDLYRKGHPGVVRAPHNDKNREVEVEVDNRRNPLSRQGPFGDSAEFGHAYPYNPLVDEPPLKFDPASDRFYGNPTPDTREKLALSNSPVKVEDNPSRERGLSPEDYFQPKPLKRSRSTEEEAPAAGGEEDTTSPASAEVPAPRQPDDRFYYDRPYNPPDYSTDYDAGGAEGNERERGDNEPNYDFVGLDENFAPERQSSNDDGLGLPDDFFDFPGDPNDRGLGGFRPRAGNGRDSEERRGGNDYDAGTTDRDESDRRPPPPQPPAEEQPTRGNNPDYENNSRERENDYGGFGSSSGDGTNNPRDAPDHDRDDAPEESYDTGFIQTLKQFDEEIKKLQEEERNKLLQASPLPPEQILNQRPAAPISSTTSGYKKGTPLIITSPGPLDHEHSQGVGSTIGVTDDFAGPPPPAPPPSDSSENHSGEDTTAVNSSAAEDDDEEEDEDANTDRSVGHPDHSTERSGEEEDEEKKKK